MFKIIGKAALAVFLCLGLVTAQAEEQNVIIVKTGSYALSDTSQTVTTLLGSAPFNATEDSDSELGIEYELRMDNNLSLGGEFLMYSNKYTSFGIPGEADSVLIMFNAKKYFDVADNFKAFVGGGIGAASVDLSGNITGSAGGIGLQLMGGIEYRIQQFGLYAEYKVVSAEPEDADGASVDISGSGIFFGGAVHF